MTLTDQMSLTAQFVGLKHLIETIHQDHDRVVATCMRQKREIVALKAENEKLRSYLREHERLAGLVTQ